MTISCGYEGNKNGDRCFLDEGKDLTFSEVVRLMKAGAHIARSSWKTTQLRMGYDNRRHTVYGNIGVAADTEALSARYLSVDDFEAVDWEVREGK
jgi:hypothetical protein